MKTRLELAEIIKAGFEIHNLRGVMGEPTSQTLQVSGITHSYFKQSKDPGKAKSGIFTLRLEYNIKDEDIHHRHITPILNFSLDKDSTYTSENVMEFMESINKVLYAHYKVSENLEFLKERETERLYNNIGKLKLKIIRC